MLRSTFPLLNYRATVELDRIRGLLRGRARLERKVGLKRLLFLMRTQTRYRVEQQSFWERAVVRKNVDSAAQEHGGSWSQLKNDLARHNIHLFPRSQQTLAQYEPLAFRAVMELCASHVPPPPPPLTAQVPVEAYMPTPEDPHVAHPAARRELQEGLARMLSSGSSSALSRGPKTVEGWMDSWKEFDVAASKK